MADLLLDLIRANAVGAAAVLTVLAARAPVRRGLGADAAYRLWIVPPLAFAASLLPAREVLGAASRYDAPAWAAELAAPLLAAWAVGAGLSVLVLALTQHAFLRAAQAGRAGPAVVGILTPRIVMPRDDGGFSPEERALIRAHELKHLERGDACANAVMAALQCLLWFNPLAHVAVRAARLDQEIACDAAVLRRRPAARALYARTLLKAQLSAAPVPLGAACASHPLETRIALISRPPRDEGPSGPLTVGAGALGACVLAWSLTPPVAPVEPLSWRPSEAEPPAMNVLMIRAQAASSPVPA